MKSLLLLILLVTHITEAKIAPPEMNEFNRACPAPKLCEEVSAFIRKCGQEKHGPACDRFIENFQKLLPEYDCQRSFDVTPTVKYIVPAFWLCDSREQFLSYLSKMKSREARRVFGSRQMREALEGAGHLAEEYVPKSLKAAK